ncbi:MAG: TrkH family potassium uptake protein [Acidobacteriota bacterium]|nr:TrkH family potassium uptake protein [Acidobacteriota bacterium]
MNWYLVLRIIGVLAGIMAVAMIPSLGLAAFGGDPEGIAAVTTSAFGRGITLSALVSAILLLTTWGRVGNRFSASDGFAIATFGWLLLAVLAAVPLYLCKGMTPLGDDLTGASPNWRFTFVDAFFEAMGGLTTTSSSVFGTDGSVEGGRGLVEGLPPSFLFMRSLCHWLGGMGIVVLCLALLPALSAGGYQVFQAEVPGPAAEKLRPRLRETAAILWGVYAAMTAVLVLLFWLGKMPLLDAICHAFGTISTGGCSTKDASIAHYAQMGHPSALYFEVVTIVFMLFSSISFLLHFQALRGSLEGYRRNEELRFYAVVLVASTLLVGLGLALWGGSAYAAKATLARHAVFQVVSIATSTGYYSADFDAWPALCRIVLIALAFGGGCAASTAGGLKQIRLLVLFRYCHREVMRLLRPGLERPIRVGDAIVDSRRVSQIVGLMVLWVGVIVVGSVVLAFLLHGADNPSFDGHHDSHLVTVLTATVACVSNVGPGLSGAGPTQNYGWMPAGAKLLLSFCCLLGRLEIYSVIILLLPRTWRG